MLAMSIQQPFLDTAKMENVLFQQQIPMIIQQQQQQPPSNTQSTHRQITVTVVLCPSQLLQITLTDENDPFFLYQLDIGAEDFLELKQGQNLLIDFSQFPQKFIELLLECSSKTANNKAFTKENPAFVAQFSQSSSFAPSSLSLVEKNSFKAISHLSLNFVPGNDADVKRYLASLVNSLKSENNQLNLKLKHTESSLSEELSKLRTEHLQMAQNYENLRLESIGKENQLKNQLGQELQKEREKFQREKDNFLRELETSKSSIVARYEQQLSALNSSSSKSQQQFDDANNRLRQLESQCYELGRSRDQLLSEKGDFIKTVQRLEMENKDFQSTKLSLSHTLDSYSRQIEMLERTVSDKQNALQNLEQNSRQFALEKSKVDETIANLRSQVSSLESQLKSQIGDNTKANEIIQKLQTDLRAVKGKLKLKVVVAAQQEKLLEEKNSIFDNCQRECNDLKELLHKQENEFKNVKLANEDLKHQVEKNRKTIEENNSVIEWLHRQLNDDVLRRPLTMLNSDPTKGVDYLKRSQSSANIQKSTNTLPKYQQHHSAKYAGPNNQFSSQNLPTSVTNRMNLAVGASTNTSTRAFEPPSSSIGGIPPHLVAATNGNATKSNYFK